MAGISSSTNHWGGTATIVAVSGATLALATTTLCSCGSPNPQATTFDSPSDTGQKVSEARLPACSTPPRQMEQASGSGERRRRNTTSREALASGTEKSGDATYGHGFAWDDREKKPLEDAASQVFSLCLKWRAAGETLNMFKLNKLEFIISRQICAADLHDGALARQRFTTALIVSLLNRWVVTDTRGPPQAAAARRDKVDAIAARLRNTYTIQGMETEVCGATQEGWRHTEAGTYVQWLEREIHAAGSQNLAVSPLKHVLLHYDRSLLLEGGLWLEFGVAEGATLGLIASHIPSHLADGVVVGSGKSSGKCFGFDSFTGLPEDWRPGFDSGHFRRKRGEPPSFSDEVEVHLSIVQGWFEDTLPAFLREHDMPPDHTEQAEQPVALLHLDSDIYSAAIFVLRTLIADGRIVHGSVIVFDELFNYCGFENHESLALFEIVQQYGLEYEWIGMQQKGRMQAALRVTAVAGCASAVQHTKALVPTPWDDALPGPPELLQKTEMLSHAAAATSEDQALNTAMQKLEDLKAKLQNLEDRGKNREGDETLHGALALNCESLTRATVDLHHRQQQQLAHRLTSRSTISPSAASLSAKAASERCMEGDALMAKQDFAAAAVQYGRSAAAADSEKASATFKKLQSEALLKAKAQKKNSKKQRQSHGKSKQQTPIVSIPRPRRHLPESLAKGNCRFDVQVTGAMARALAQELLEIPVPAENEQGTWPEAAVRTSLESYKITEQMKRMQLRSVPVQVKLHCVAITNSRLIVICVCEHQTSCRRGRKEFFRKLSNDCPQFCALYEQFIEEEIGPLLLAEFVKEQQAQSDDDPPELDLATRTVLYQFPPAVRIYCSHITKPRKYSIPKHASADAVGSSDCSGDTDGRSDREGNDKVVPAETDGEYVALTKVHADSLYGHQDGEVNFWMPFTSVDETSTLWAETEPNKGDWYPFYPLGPGGCWRFPGTNCRHFTKPNISGKTRVSLDFRCSVASCYDEKWKKPGNSERHGMRSVVLPTTVVQELQEAAKYV